MSGDRNLKRRLGGVLFACLLCLPAAGQGVPALGSDYRVLPPVDLWSGTPPVPLGWVGLAAAPVQEKTITLPQGGAIIINVTQPTFQAYLPKPETATGAGVIIAPGGGFRALSITTEGTRVAEWLASRGIAAFILKYRLVQQEATEEATRAKMAKASYADIGKVSVDDGLRALDLIRAKAKDYGVDPARVGVIGYSAGGHVAAMMAMEPDPARRPAFAAPIYGGAFLDPMPEMPKAYLEPVPPKDQPWSMPLPKTPAPGALPPLFLAMAQDDQAVSKGFWAFYDALAKAGYRTETHLYMSGGHGFSMHDKGDTAEHYVDAFYWWLEALGMLKAAK